MTDNWESQIKRFQDKIQKRIVTIHANTAMKLRDSVVFGNRTEAGGLTGSPGQPVDTGNLRNSWQLTHPAALLARLSTNVEYAPAIEDGVGPYGPMTLQSEVGGFHSVKLTRAGFQKLVDAAVREEVRD